MTGWIKVHRSIAITKMWLEEPFTRGQAWVDLLLLAAHKDVEIWPNATPFCMKRGQIVTSIVKLSSKWQWSRSKTKRFLNGLTNVHMIEQQTDTQKTVITICNYDEYQRVADTQRAANDTTVDTTTVTAIEQRSSSDRAHTRMIKNYKNEKEDKNVFNPAGKTKYLDWVYLDEVQYQSVQSYYLAKGLEAADIDEAIRELDSWFGNNPKKRATRTDDAKTLKGWPLDKAIERKTKMRRLEPNKPVPYKIDLSKLED